MRVLIVRHAIAAERIGYSGPDESRPLTEEGIRRFRRSAPAIAGEVPDLALVATSPLQRARKTADLLRQACPGEPTTVELDALAPVGEPQAVIEFLRRQRRTPAVAVVGHEPGLSKLAALLVTGTDRPFGVLKKGGAALIDFAGPVGAGRGKLLWQATPAQLRALAR